MQTSTATATSTLQANLMQLPILQHFSQNELVTSVDSYRKGEKPIFSVLRLAVIGGLLYGGYMVLTKILPQIFAAIGIFAYYATIAGLVIGSIIMIPVFFKWMRLLAKSASKALIKSDPFGELATQKQKMLQNKQVFRISKSKIDALKNDMQVEARNSETEATNLQKQVVASQTKCGKLKAELEEMVRTGGADARNSDAYVEGQAELIKMLADSQRMMNKLAQSKDFITKYGTRAAVMKKMGQKLVMVEASMEIKIADFDATVEMLKKDYDFAQKSRAATDAAKSAMLFDKSWELDYALDVVTATIASDIYITSGNLRDIDNLTSQYTIDSDELYTNLSLLADNIKVGKDVIPDSKKYNSIDYNLTSDDKLKSGLLGDMF